MKSIVQEGSSIAKAIDSAWKRAEQPTEFSVRINEHPQKNMFGFTTKSAKISLFYQEERKKERPMRQAQKPRPKKIVEKPAPAKAKKAPAAPRPRTQESNEPWNENMVNFAQTWLNDLLRNLGANQAKFVLEPQRYHLKVTFTKPVFTEDEKNRALFRNCAHLLLQSARNNFKRPLKGFKVVLTTGQ